MKELGFTNKLFKLTKIVMKDIKVVVITHDGRSAEIGIEKGVGQGDGLSAILLNISLERLVSAISEKKTSSNRACISGTRRKQKQA